MAGNLGMGKNNLGRAWVKCGFRGECCEYHGLPEQVTFARISLMKEHYTQCEIIPQKNKIIIPDGLRQRYQGIEIFEET